jgi:hypothetical protein
VSSEIGPGKDEAAVMAESVAGEGTLLEVGSEMTRVELSRWILLVVRWRGELRVWRRLDSMV